MRRIARSVAAGAGIVAALWGIAAPAAAGIVRPGTEIDGPKSLNVTSGGLIPTSQLLSTRSSRAVLRRIRAGARPGSCLWRDVDFVTRLADRYLRRGVPLGRRLTVARTVRVNAWWYRRPRPTPTRGTVIGEVDGILSTYWGCRGFAVNPVATTGRWTGLNAGVSTVNLAKALVPLGSARRSGSHTFRVWEYYDIPEQPGVISPGTSGMAQGRVAQVLARAYVATGQRRFLLGAVDAMNVFTVSVKRGGARALLAYPAGTPGRPWFVERAFPGADPWRGAALNGFMVAILHLNSIGAVLERTPPSGPDPLAEKYSRLATRLAAQGSTTLLYYLPLHDSGSWSYYAMLAAGHPWRTYLAPIKYHCYHLTLLGQLETAYPGVGYDVWRAQWVGYLAASGQTCPTK